MTPSWFLALLLAGARVGVQDSPRPAPGRWHEILGPPRGQMPVPRRAIVWGTDQRRDADPTLVRTPPTGPAFEAGLRQEHDIVAVNGERPDLSGRAFLVWFRLRTEPGDEVRLTVDESGREREIVYRAPASLTR